jgi:hypothetical protein
MSTVVTARVIKAWAMCGGILGTILLLLILKDESFQGHCHKMKVCTVLSIFPFGIGAMVLGTLV